MTTPLHRLIPLSLAAACILHSPAHAQDLGFKAGAQTKPIVVINATVHPVSGPEIADGYIRFEAGKITAVGPSASVDAERLKAEGVEVVDARNLHVYPGLIASATQLGLTEISAVRATLDYAEVGSATPEVRSVVAVNPDSTLIPVTRTNGVLTAGVFPLTTSGGLISYFDGPGGIIPGRAGVIRLDGWTWEDMTIIDDAGVVINWPQPRPITAWWMNKSAEDQQKDIDEQLSAIEQFIVGAASYHAARANNPTLPTDLRFEAMKSVLPATAAAGSSGTGGPAPATAQRPVFILANDYDQIQQAVTFCAKHRLRCVLAGGHDAPLHAELLKRHDVTVMVPGTIRFPKRDDSPYDEAYTLPARLHEAGVKFCLASGEEAAHERNLPYSAALACAYGLPVEIGIRSITLSAAEALGIADRLGSIEPGKAATIIVTDGNPLEITTSVRTAFIDGRRINLANKQTDLDRKYREKYRQNP